MKILDSIYLQLNNRTGQSSCTMAVPFFYAISVGLMACINLNVLFSNSNSSMQQLESFTSLTFSNGNHSCKNIYNAPPWLTANIVLA